MVSFVSMNRAAAREHLAGFLAVMPERLDRLRQRSAAGGGPAADTLDLSVASLGPLWTWAQTVAAMRPQFREVPNGQPPVQIDLDSIESESELPDWFGEYPQMWAPFTADTLWLIDGVGRYLGETLIAATPGARWIAGNAKARGYAYQNHPVVTGSATAPDLQPFRAVGLSLRTILTDGGERDLSQMAKSWTAHVV